MRLNVCIFAVSMSKMPSYVHPLERGTEALPDAFTFPFRYTPHPLCQRAALIVQEKLREMGVTEGKMYGVMVVRGVKSEELRANSEEFFEGSKLYFLAAYSGQLLGGYDHPWFVPPVVDYLSPDSYFQREQGEIVEMGRRMEALRDSEERKAWQARVAQLYAERDAAVAEAKRVYKEGRETRARERERMKNEEIRNNNEEWCSSETMMIRESQQQKADIQRAKRLHQEEITELEGRLATLNTAMHELYEERKRRSEALQQWLFEQFVFLNGRGEKSGLIEIFRERSFIPSGAGECCAPKLLQTAYQLGLEPLAMAEFWWGTSSPDHYRQPGAFFPACRSKCYPILGFMLQGLNVEPDPAEHYEQALKPVRILWEDESLAVIEKPEGWCSIPGKSDQANLFDEAHRLWPDIEGSIIVHRLDQDTSGVMVIAKNARIHRALCQQFERREVKKKYIALLEGQPSIIHHSSIISLPIGPDLENMPRQQVDHKDGKEAVTLYEVIGEERFVCCRGTAKTITRIAFYPQTGRTHQLRVHSASPEGLNTPILGDRLYGPVADRLYLHASAIDFIHPVTHEHLHFEVPCPF